MRRGSVRLALAGLLVSAVTGGAVVGGSAKAAVSGTVAGTVFADYNANGVLDPGNNLPATAAAQDVGVKGAAVRVTDSTGAVVASGATTAAGTFNLPVNAATDDVRVTVTPPGTFVPGPHGPASATTVQFVKLSDPAAQTIGVALTRPGDYTQPAPDVLNVEQVGTLDQLGQFLAQGDKPTLVSSPYATRGPALGTPEAFADQNGSTWGLATLGTQYAFTAAYLRAHARTGLGGPGAIYLTDLAQAPNAAPWVTVPNAGANPRGNEATMDQDAWLHDAAAFPEIDKTSLGALAMGPDLRTLYVVNLKDRGLYRVPFTVPGAGAPVAGTPTRIALPLALPGAAAGCAPAWVRPFGVTAQNGALWVTLTCTGPSLQDAGVPGVEQETHLRGYLYRYDLGTRTFGAKPAFETALSGYPRGKAALGLSYDSDATWETWQDTGWPTGVSNGSARPQPLLSDVVFDSNGDLTLGIKDRFGDQGADTSRDLDHDAGVETIYITFPAGDVLRACRNAADTAWVQESNGSCGTRATSAVGPLAGKDDGEGPGPGPGPDAGYGEFYNDDLDDGHDQLSLGGLLQLPGFGEVANTSFGATGLRNTEGVRFYPNLDGTSTGVDGSRLLLGPPGFPPGGFGKAGGLGDLAALVLAAPLEIGNRVWLDSDHDGLQDAGETPLANVTVRLFAADGTTLLGTAVTDTGGNYFFSSAAGPGGLPPPSDVYAIADLLPATDFVVRLDNAADYGAGGPLVGLTPTLRARGPDRAVDSNGRPISPTLVQAGVGTGGPGVDDHTIDFGFATPTYAVGDYVWFDTDRDGHQDPKEKPVKGARATLTDAVGNPVTHADGTPVPAVRTDAHGYYVFDFLPPGDYRVRFDKFPAGYGLTLRQVGAVALDSNPDRTTGVTATFTLGPGGANMRPTTPADHLVAVAIDPTIDAGLIRGPAPTPPPPDEPGTDDGHLPNTGGSYVDRTLGVATATLLAGAWLRFLGRPRRSGTHRRA